MTPRFGESTIRLQAYQHPRDADMLHGTSTHCKATANLILYTTAAHQEPSGQQQPLNSSNQCATCITPTLTRTITTSHMLGGKPSLAGPGPIQLLAASPDCILQHPFASCNSQHSTHTMFQQHNPLCPDTVEPSNQTEVATPPLRRHWKGTKHVVPTNSAP